MKIRILLTVCVLFMTQLGHAADPVEGGAFDPGAMINHHIKDAHSWEIVHGVTLPLPVILYSEEKGLEVFSSANFYDENHQPVPYNGYVMDHEHISMANGGHVLDFSITKNVLFLFMNAALLIAVFMTVARSFKRNEGKPPRGLQSFFEPLIVYIRDEIAEPNIGPKYQRYLPYLLTLFFFIWFGNLLGLLPAAANLTGNIAVTMLLALISLIITTASGNKTYWMHILDPLGDSMHWTAKIPLYIILLPIELIGIFTKPFSLMIRLFANITAGHIIILSILSLTFITQSIFIGAIASVFASVMMLLELFVAILQAYIFTLLSAMYFGQAVQEHH